MRYKQILVGVNGPRPFLTPNYSKLLLAVEAH